MHSTHIKRMEIYHSAADSPLCIKQDVFLYTYIQRKSTQPQDTFFETYRLHILAQSQHARTQRVLKNKRNTILP